MKIKKTKHGFSFKAENSEDSKALGKLVVVMSKKEESPSVSKEDGQLHTTPDKQEPKYPADCRYKSVCETIKKGIDGSDVCAKSRGIVINNFLKNAPKIML